MLWQVEILPKANDVEKQRVAREFALLLAGVHAPRAQWEVDARPERPGRGR